MTGPDFASFLKQEYPEGHWPSPFHILEGLEKVKGGKPINDAAREVRTTPAKFGTFSSRPRPRLKSLA